MDNLDLSKFELVHPTAIRSVEEDGLFYDLNVIDDHSFFVRLPKSDSWILVNNCDGSHISMLYIGFFYKYCPSIIKEGRLKKLRTPIICLLDKKNEFAEMFFTFDEYNEYLKKNPNHGYKTHYFKGLGTWKANQFKALVKKFGLDALMETLSWDPEAAKLVDDWLGSKNADVRKEYLKENNFSIFGI